MYIRVHTTASWQSGVVRLPRYRLSRERKKRKEKKGPQVTFIHPQWKGANVHAKNDEGITPLDKMAYREKDHISLIGDLLPVSHSCLGLANFPKEPCM